MFLCSSIAFSQSLSVFDVDASNFPTIKAKFYAFDKDGNQLTNLSPPDFEVKENGQPRTVTNVSCPAPKPPVELSSVLVFDVSGSMSGIGLDIAKSVANTWINILPLGNSDCAITSFSDGNYINQDFTTNKNKLVNAINGLTIISGTNYNAAMIDPAAGGILMAKTGKHKRIIIFLTDGQPNFEPRTQEIINEAIKNNITIYCLSINMPVHASMIEFSKQTGGLYYENIRSNEEASDILRNIFSYTQNSDFCEIEWQSSINCQSTLTNVELKLNTLNLTDKASYLYPNSSIAYLDFSPTYINFKDIPPGTKKDTTITITAINSDFNITNISSSNPLFILDKTNFNLKKDQSIELNITFAPNDSGYCYSLFSFESLPCSTNLYMCGGFLGVKPKIKTLKVVKPNGGEKVIVGSDFLISWEGIPDKDSVKIEYSIDSGKTWNLIIDMVSGLKYIWKKVPKPISSNCLIRIKQLSESYLPGTLQTTIIGNTNGVNNVSWSPDGSRIATAGFDGKIIIWDAINGTKIHTLSGHNDKVLYVSWSPDGSRVATASIDKTARIWDAASGSSLHTLTHSYGVNAISWSPDGTRVATASDDSTAKIWDIETGDMLHVLRGHRDYVIAVSWSPDGSRVATTAYDRTARIWDIETGVIIHILIGHTYSPRVVNWSPDGTRVATVCPLVYDNTARIWDAKSGVLLNTLSGHGSNVHTVNWSPDGSRVATASWGNETSRIWDIVSGITLLTLSGHTSSVSDVRWSPDGTRLATSSHDSTAKIWQAETGVTLHTLLGHTNYVTGVRWSPDGTRVATASDDGTVKIWYINNSSLQEDESDSLFAIVAPQASANSIDMKECLVGMIKDSVISNVIENIGSYPIRIDSLYFAGSDSPNFRLLSHILPLTIQPGNKISLEFGFGPTRVGLHTANMVVITQTDTLVKQIIGTGFQPQLAINSKIIDFGQLEIGNERTFIDTALVKNISLSPISINNVIQMGPDKTQFEILSNLASFTLQPGEEKKLTLKFKPIYGGRTTGQIAFAYNGVGSPAIVGLFGTGIGGNLRISNDSAYVGESRNLILQMENVKPEGIAAIAPNFEAVIRFQRTILAPLNNANWNMTKDSTYLTVKGKFANSSVIAEIPVIAGLGNVEVSTMDIVDFKLTDDSGNKVDYDFEYESGTFTLLGLCEEGGKRLVNPYSKAGIVSISPNPAENQINLVLSLSEFGNTEVCLYNILGEKVSTIYSENVTLKEILPVNSDLSKIASGQYILIFRTPTYTETRQLLILR
jgi:WD40 repeat protein